MGDLLAGLDEQQRQVATTFGGPVAVIAGAGTGKTRAITHRIAYGVHQGHYDPRAVLAVTFTTKAAGELRGRLRDLGLPQVQARTFHSAALRQAQYFWPQVMNSALPAVTDQSMGLIAAAARKIGIKIDKGALRDATTEIGWAKVSNVLPDDYPEVAASLGRKYESLSFVEIASLAKAYEEIKADRQVIDFDDILLVTASLLAENPKVATEVRAAYRHFIVDEFQDVSPLQHSLLSLWLGDSSDICVVGDPAQTIHSFAGATPKYLTGFRARYPGAAVLNLVRDYRSTPEVIALANSVAAPLTEQVQLRPVRESGPEPVLAGFSSAADEAARVAEFFVESNKQGVPWRELAALYRVNAQSPVLEAALTEAGVPYAIKGAEGFFERGEVRQAVRLLGKQGGDPLAALDLALDSLGWTAAAPEGGGSVRERWESLAALRSLVADLVADDPEVTVADILAEFSYREAAAQAPRADAVTLATIHSAKGLEWEGVAIIGVQDGLLPYVLAQSAAELAEERRLLYVGVTRAKTRLLLTWNQGRSGNRRPSRFLGARPAQVVLEAAPVRPRGSALAKTCRVCARPLSVGAERKLGRHLDCEATYDEELWAALKAWRLAEAREASVPAFVIFTDATLMAVAESVPKDAAGLLRISGVGKAKLEKYGAALLTLLAAHSDSAGAAATGEIRSDSSGD